MPDPRRQVYQVGEFLFIPRVQHSLLGSNAKHDLLPTLKTPRIVRHPCPRKLQPAQPE